MPNRNVEGNYRYKYQGQEVDPETGKEAFELRLWDSRIGRWLTTDPAGQFSSPYLGMGNNPVSRIDPDGGYSPPTDYVDENGNLIMHTEDGSNAVVTVTNDKLEGFLASVRGTSLEALNSKDWNFTMKSYLVGFEWNQAVENMQSWLATPNARRNAVRYWQTGDINYWDEMQSEHLASFRDPVSYAVAITGGLYGASVINSTSRRNTSLLKNGKLAGGNHPVTGVIFKRNGFPDFRKHLYKGGSNDVMIAPTGSRTSDFAAANRAAGYSSTPKGYTWHHHELRGRMQLVNSSVHSKTGHSGGFSTWSR